MIERKTNSNTVLFLGSGATAGSDFKKNGKLLPSDSNFFENLSEIMQNWECAYPALHLYRENISKTKSLYKTWNDLFIYRGLAVTGIVREPQETHNAFNALANCNWPKNYEFLETHYQNQFKTMNTSLHWEYYLAELAIWDLRVLVKDVYEFENAPKGDYPKFWEKLKNDAFNIQAVVNLNYDTTFDDALRGKFYYPGNGEPKEKKIPLIRPHGSLRWTSRANWKLGRCWDTWTESYDDQPLGKMGFKNKNDPSLLEFSQSLIVPPAFFKEEVVGNSSMPGLQSQILHRQWVEMDRALRECASWVFVGISFASGDDHLLWLLKRNKPNCKKIYCSSYNGTKKPLKKLKEAFGNNIEYAELEIPKDKCLSKFKLEKKNK